MTITEWTHEQYPDVSVDSELFVALKAIENHFNPNLPEYVEREPYTLVERKQNAQLRRKIETMVRVRRLSESMDSHTRGSLWAYMEERDAANQD